MPKIKSHSGAKKRFSKSASGKWRHYRPGRRHLIAPMKNDRRRSLNRKNELTGTEGRTMSRFLPYA
ncbi:MAG: 50S ribosomal protein L35 [Elusimicrobia bacterium]|nr:50S ribosomal protein L35 [Elusimicrobiota bacterium]